MKRLYKEFQIDYFNIMKSQIDVLGENFEK